ncbi:hypothetical protein DFQ01_108132 [Paenibacillus cellulosilyticus]|uniref:Butirosin biosynthesis protein H-like n=1 Tax=Paenibacillus cellulosilyticus TaxID=375489 RepID=A0A2V2YTV7_9BACL|nr:hypothetical protein DFQ01_108132 [Paenibacillus cellulosilyticus]
MKNDEMLDCHENLIASYASSVGCDYEMMFIRAWDFRFGPAEQSTTQLIGPRLSAQRTPDYEWLRQFHGISLEMNDRLSSDQVYRHVQEELLQNNPVAVGMDAYWCPWYKAPYQKMHFMHYTFVTRTDKDNGDLYGINIIEGSQPARLPFTHFEQGCLELTLFRRVAATQISLDWEKLLKQAAEKLLHNGRSLGTFDEMRQFAASLVAVDIKAEVEGYTALPLIAPLFYETRETFRGRRQFAMALDWMNRRAHTAVLADASAALQDLSSRWRTVFDLLMKAYFSPEPAEVMAYISTIVNGLADDEEKLAESILSV